MMDIDTDTLAQTVWEYMLMHQPLEKADAILVLGNSDLKMAEYAAQLFNEEWAPLVIFSGRAGRSTVGVWEVTEAEKFAEVAMANGLPKDKILLEKQSTNTGENILFTKQLLAEKELYPKKLILIQKPYQERRLYGTFVKQWPEMDFLVSSPDISFEDYSKRDRSKEYVINMMVGELQRVKEYPERGFIIPQEIPDNVWAAYEELIRRGFSEHLIT